MRRLPEQAVHLPFAAGPYRMAMDLVTVPETEWFELDQRYGAEMAERRRLLDAVHDQVFAAVPISDPARAEALTLIVAALTAHHPDWFSRDGSLLHNHLTAETWRMFPEAGQYTAVTDRNEPFALDPLELAGRLVQEDLCVIQNAAEGPVFTAGVLCFPSRWRLMEKIGRPLSAVHGPGPALRRPPGEAGGPFHAASESGACRVPAELVRAGRPDTVSAYREMATRWRHRHHRGQCGSRMYLRVERQTLRRLPASGAVLFGIRVHCYELGRAIDRPSRAAELAAAVRALPADIVHYKSLLPFRDALLGWLDRQSQISSP